MAKKRSFAITSLPTESPHNHLGRPFGFTDKMSLNKNTNIMATAAAAPPSLLSQVGMAGTAAVLTVTCIHPIDVIKVRGSLPSGQLRPVIVQVGKSSHNTRQQSNCTSAGIDSNLCLSCQLVLRAAPNAATRRSGASTNRRSGRLLLCMTFVKIRRDVCY